jgi:hypothetical protein
MKILLTTLLLLVINLTAICQSYDQVTYKALVHNPQGQIVAKHQVTLRLSVFKGNPFDTVIYSETHRPVTDELGLASVIIGSGTGKSGDFETIDWGNDKYFMKVEVDAAGGSDFTDLGTTQILTIPYSTSADHSKKTDEAVSEDKLLISRKYVGKFLDFRQTGPNEFNGPNIVWIKTTMEKSFGKISAFGKKCEFTPGDNLYLKRMYYSPGGVFGHWEYRIENDASVYYRVTDYQYDRKVLVETWFK